MNTSGQASASGWGEQSGGGTGRTWHRELQQRPALPGSLLELRSGQWPHLCPALPQEAQTKERRLEGLDRPCLAAEGCEVCSGHRSRPAQAVWPWTASRGGAARKGAGDPGTSAGRTVLEEALPTSQSERLGTRQRAQDCGRGVCRGRGWARLEGRRPPGGCQDTWGLGEQQTGNSLTYLEPRQAAQGPEALSEHLISQVSGV